MNFEGECLVYFAHCISFDSMDLRDYASVRKMNYDEARKFIINTLKKAGYDIREGMGIYPLMSLKAKSRIEKELMKYPNVKVVQEERINMRVTCLSHSLIHPRQYLFFDYLNTLEGVEVQQIYPWAWGSQRRDGGFKISGDSVGNYVFGDWTVKAIKEFSPDLLYTQAEWWSMQAYRSTRWAERLRIPHVLFTWENLRQPAQSEQRLLQKQALVICGNREAEAIVKPYNENTVVMPQVGISSSIFMPLEKVKKSVDVLFVGREVLEKGIEYIRRFEEDGYNVLREKGVEYTEQPPVYNSAKVLVVPSLKTETWMEQLPGCIVEAFLCGVPVVAFDSGSIRSNYDGSGIVLVDEGNYEDLKEAINTILEGRTLLPKVQISQNLRKWAMENMGHEAVADKLVKIFEEVQHAET